MQTKVMPSMIENIRHIISEFEMTDEGLTNLPNHSG